MVPPARLERTAPRLGIWCSIHLSYGGTDLAFAASVLSAVQTEQTQTQIRLEIFTFSKEVSFLSQIDFMSRGLAKNHILPRIIMCVHNRTCRALHLPCFFPEWQKNNTAGRDKKHRMEL